MKWLGNLSVFLSLAVVNLLIGSVNLYLGNYVVGSAGIAAAALMVLFYKLETL
jgi:hypothetical protein